MTEVILNNNYTFVKENNTFVMSEKDVKFDIVYSIKNPKTGASSLFEFIESTGCEFDPNTKWIYKNREGVLLEVCNDKEISRMRERAYLKHKLR